MDEQSLDSFSTSNSRITHFFGKICISFIINLCILFCIAASCPPPPTPPYTDTNISFVSKNWGAKYCSLPQNRNEGKPVYVEKGTWGQTRRCCNSWGSQTTLASASPTDPPHDLVSLSSTGWGIGVLGNKSVNMMRKPYR